MRVLFSCTVLLYSLALLVPGCGGDEHVVPPSAWATNGPGRAMGVCPPFPLRDEAGKVIYAWLAGPNAAAMLQATSRPPCDRVIFSRFIHSRVACVTHRVQHYAGSTVAGTVGSRCSSRHTPTS